MSDAVDLYGRFYFLILTDNKALNELSRVCRELCAR
jgi:hypothetical protein